MSTEHTDAWHTIRDALREAAMLQQEVDAGRLKVSELWTRLDALAAGTEDMLEQSQHDHPAGEEPTP